MKTLFVQNVHEALPFALRYLHYEGYNRDSRNGPVRISPVPVTTIYNKPWQRVLFWSQRDANPFFHLYESLWMLAGRDDLAGVVKYAKNMASYSDDGHTFHGAYGARWRNWFDLQHPTAPYDQLRAIADRLRKDPNDRRCILQMWDAETDLDNPGKDVPCNTTATFQRDQIGRLDLIIFCRSNDIIWGAYGANAVHFSMLLEYMALKIGCPMGRMYQVSVNWHAYLETLKQCEPIRNLIDRGDYIGSYYDAFKERVHHTPMENPEEIDIHIAQILTLADNDLLHTGYHIFPKGSWPHEVSVCLEAHEYHRMKRYGDADRVLTLGSVDNDWNRACREWLQRRREKREEPKKPESVGGTSV